MDEEEKKQEHEFVRNEKGQFVGFQPNGMTKENARERQAMGVQSRRERALAAAELGLLDGLPPDVVAKDVFGGIRTVVAALTRMALSEKGHASVRAAELLFKMVEASPESGGGQQGGNINVQIPASTAVRLLKLMDEQKPTVIDVTPRVHDAVGGSLVPDEDD